MQILFILLTLVFAVLLGINDEVSAAVLFFLGAGLIWHGSYQAASGLIYARGSSRVLIPVIHAVLVGGGFALLLASNAMLSVFDFQFEAVEYGYMALSLGLLFGATTRPAPDKGTVVKGR